jgi:hypothetical protein
MTTPMPPFVAFIAFSGPSGAAPGVLYTDGGSPQKTAVYVQFAVTDSTSACVLQPASALVALEFTDASGNTTKKIRSRLEDAVLSQITGGQVVGANEDNVIIVWVD